MKKYGWVGIALLLTPVGAHAQPSVGGIAPGSFGIYPPTTVGSLESCVAGIDGRVQAVTDGADATDCTTGSGTTPVLCQCDGGATTWNSVPDGSGHGNGANCSAGNSPLGVDENGAVEGCFDVATEAELTTHTANASAHHTATVDTGPSPDCSGTLTYQDGEGNCDAYTLGGNTTSLATTSGTLTSGDCVEFDASGNLVASGASCGAGSGAQSTTFGTSATATGTRSTSFGFTATATGTNYTTALGSYASAGTEAPGYQTAVGYFARATQQYATALGASSLADEDYCVAIGNSANCSAGNQVAWSPNLTSFTFGSAFTVSTSTGITTVTDVLSITARATAPASCTAYQDIYADTSGALCWCSATNTWSVLSGGGSCT